MSGIFYGHLGLIREVMGKVGSRKWEVGSKKLKVILTGGYATFFSKYFPDFVIDEDITLKGLEIIFGKIRGLV